MRLSLLHEKPVPRYNLNKAFYPVDVPATSIYDKTSYAHNEVTLINFFAKII